MTYVALLRGINVGGHAKVEMPRLKQLFITLGCTDVMTYINSGNVIFSDGRTAKELSLLIEAAMLAEFGLAVHGQVGATWQILAQQSVGVFVRTTLPG